jgi:hypothetical protein
MPQFGGFKGKIIDDDGTPFNQVMIRVTHPSLQGFQGCATDEDGCWIIPFLPTGFNFVVEAYHPQRGYSRQLADNKYGEETEVNFWWDWDKSKKDFPPLPECDKTEIYVPWEFCPSCGKRMPHCQTIEV